MSVAILFLLVAGVIVVAVIVLKNNKVTLLNITKFVLKYEFILEWKSPRRN